MCIIFLHYNNDPNSKYKLIVAANRDEYLDRPAKPADYHPQHPDVLCGVDMQPGVEGGTWLGVSKSGRFSALTNHLADGVDQTKLPRGNIVLDYLKGDAEPLEYLRSLQGRDYRGFNLLAGGFAPDGNLQVGFYSNRDGKDPRLLVEKTSVLPCATIDTKWRKAEHGRGQFVEVLRTCNSTNPECLTDNLLTLLSDTTCLYPDPMVIKQCHGMLGEVVLAKYCSIRIVDLPTYGTRMQTVVIVDKNNELHFTERSLVGMPAIDSEWTKKSFSFTITK